jgi:hypothetical protein
MKEYTLVKLKEPYNIMNQKYPKLLNFFKDGYQSTNPFHQQQYHILLEEVENYNQVVENTFSDRKDYRKQDNLHCVKNEITKEICILIIKRYQIIAKCDRITNVLVDTLLKYDPNLVILNKEL